MPVGGHHDALELVLASYCQCGAKINPKDATYPTPWMKKAVRAILKSHHPKNVTPCYGTGVTAACDSCGVPYHVSVLGLAAILACCTTPLASFTCCDAAALVTVMGTHVTPAAPPAMPRTND